MRIWYLFALLILAISIVSVNASVTVPANIIAYLPVTLTNYQGAALATNTPIAIGVLNAFTGNVIGFNATKYQQYETCNLNNAEFFYANGTIITSWLEGNVLNENTANSVCSSSSSSNALSASSNVLYWIRIGSNAANFLPANTGTATTNTVYLGWAGNVVSAANTLFNGNTVGEAPQLSCSNAYSTATCNGVYGQYDNGNSVFSFYDNFVGGTLNSNYWSNGGGGATLTVANSIEVTGTTDDIWLYGQIPTTTQVIDTDLVSGTSGFMQLRLGYSDLANQHTRYDSVSDFGTVGNNYQIESAFGACCGTDTSLPAGLIEPYVQSFGWIGTGKLFSYINYENRLVSTDTTYAYSSPSYPGMLITYSSPGTSFTTLIQWVRSRINPPANTLPGTSFGTVQTISSEPTPTISVSNIMIDGNQYINITAYTNGGTGPYTYNFIISNSVTNSIVASQRYTGVSASSNSFFWQVPNTYAGNTLGVNVVVSGSFSSTANSIETAPLVVSKQLQGVGWTASNTAWEAGQNIPVTLTSTVSGGTNAITYGQFNGNGNYITVNKEYFQGNSFTILAWVYWPSSTNLAGGCGSNNDCGYAWSGPASTNQGFGIFSRGDLWYLNFYDDDLECSTGPSNNQWYQFGASWNSTTKNRVIWVNGASACSGTSGGNLVTSSPLIIGSAAGTWDTSASMEGSIANLQLYNTSLSASQISSLYQEGIEGAPISFNSLVGWWDLNGNENFNGANVTDYSSNQIYGTPTAVPYVTSTNTFTYNDIIYASNGMIIANSLDVMTSATSNAFTFSAAGFPVGTYIANTIVTDSATSYERVTNSIQLTVNAQLSNPTVSVSNIMIDGNQYLNMTAYVDGGNGPYTYNFVISNSITNTAMVSNTDTGVASGTESWLYQIPNSYAGNTIHANVLVTDNSDVKANSIYSPPMTLSSRLISSGLTASGSQNEEVVNSSISGGTSLSTSGQFDGAAQVVVPGKSDLNLTGSFSISVWFNQSATSAGGYRLVDRESVGGTNGYNFDTNGGSSGNALRICIQLCYSPNINYNVNQLYEGVVTYNDVDVSFYLDGIFEGSFAAANAMSNNLNLYIGAENGGLGDNFNGRLSNIQIYNSSLSPIQVNSLYSEGVTGAPISFNSLVGWWDLNGNTEDYGHSQDNGIPANLVYYTSYNAFTYNDLVYASNGTLMANSIVVSNATSDSFEFSTQGWAAGTYIANTIVTDSATSYSTVTNSITFTVENPTTTIPSCSGACIRGSGGTGVYGTTEPTSASSSSTTTSSTSVSTSTTAQTTTIPPQTTLPPPPIEVSVTPVGQTTPQLCNGTATEYSITYKSLSSTFYVRQGTYGCFTITATNATAINANVSSSSTDRLIKAINFTISDLNASVNASIGYPCRLASYSVAPFILKKGAWIPITPFLVNAGTCTVTFAVPSDPILALFQVPGTGTSISTTAQTTVPVQQQQSGSPVLLIIAALIVLVVLFAFYYRSKKRRPLRR